MTLIEYSEYSGTFEWFLSGWQNKYAENVQLCPLLLYHTYHCLCKLYFRDRKHVRITSILCAIYDCLVAISHQQSGDRHKLWKIALELFKEKMQLPVICVKAWEKRKRQKLDYFSLRQSSEFSWIWITMLCCYLTGYLWFSNLMVLLTYISIKTFICQEKSCFCVFS